MTQCRVVSEFIAALTVLAVAVACAIVFYCAVGELLSRSKPRIEYLEATVAGVEVVHTGGRLEVEVGGGVFTAYYVYRVTVILYNAGNQYISNLEFSTVDVGEGDVCTSDTCRIYDPVAFAEAYTGLPRGLEPNQAVKVVFTVLSKTNLLRLGEAPFLIRVSGRLPDGGECTTYISLFGGGA